MPQLVRLYITQTIVGFGISAVFVALLLWLNVANLWHLVTHNSAGLLAAFLLWLFNGIVFSGVQFGISIMRMSEDPTPKGPGKPQRVQASAIAIPVESNRA